MEGDQTEQAGVDDTASVLESIPEHIKAKLEELAQQVEATQDAEQIEAFYNSLQNMDDLYNMWGSLLRNAELWETPEEQADCLDGENLFQWLYQFFTMQDGEREDNEFRATVALCMYHPNNHADLEAWLKENYNNPPDLIQFGRFHKHRDELHGAAYEGEEGGAEDEYVMQGNSDMSHDPGEAENQQLTAAKPGPLPPVPANRSAERMVSRRKPVGRSKWLATNSHLARLYQQKHGGNGIWRVGQEIGISPGFRIFFFLWLLASAILSVVVAIHCLMTLFNRLFNPVTTGYWAAAGIFACSILTVHFLGSYFVAVERVLMGWLLLDDDTYFGDEDFAKKYVKKNGLDRPMRDLNYDEMDEKKAEKAKKRWEQLEAQRVKELEIFSNPIENTGCRHLLPPCYTRTFLGLPAGGKNRREMWITLPVIATTIIPGVYALIRVAILKQNVLHAIGFYIEWNLAFSTIVLVGYWLYMWYFAMRKKYGAYKRMGEHLNADPNDLDDGRDQPDDQTDVDERMTWTEDKDFLHEFALDSTTVRKNILLIIGSLTPCLVAFWIVSYEELHITAGWIISTLAVVLVVFFLREILRSDAWRPRVPYVVLFLIFFFLVFGIIGAVSAKGGVVGIFVALAFMTQVMLVRHRQLAKIEDSYEWLNPFLKRVWGRFRSDDPATPLPSGQRTPYYCNYDKVREDLRKSVKEAKQNESSRDPNREASYVPCSNVLAACFAMPCYKSCYKRQRVSPKEGPQSFAEAASEHWRLPKRYWGDEAVPATAEYKGRNEPTDKLIQTMSPRLALWLVGLFLIVVIFTYEFAKLLDYNPSTAATGQDATGTVNASGYPVCRMRWPQAHNFGIVDFAMLAELAYKGSDEWQRTTGDRGFGQWFTHTNFSVIYPRMVCPNCGIGDDMGRMEWQENIEAGGVKFLHLYAHRFNQHIVIIKSSLKGESLARDIDFWGDSMAFQIFRLFVPFLRLFSDELTADFVYAMSFLKRAMDPSGEEDLTAPVIEYIQKLANESDTKAREKMPWGPLTLVGHGTNGGLAKIIGARLGLPVVAFNSPGTGWLERKMRMASNTHQEVSVQSRDEIMSEVDQQTGATQYIRCTDKNIVTCNQMHVTLCELLRACGDQWKRSYKVCEENGAAS